MSLIVIAHNVGDFFPLFRFNLLKVSLPIIIGKPHTCPGIVCHSHLRLIKAKKKLLTKFLSHFNSSESTNLNQLSDILCPTFQLSYFSIYRTFLWWEANKRILGGQLCRRADGKRKFAHKIILDDSAGGKFFKAMQPKLSNKRKLICKIFTIHIPCI